MKGWSKNEAETRFKAITVLLSHGENVRACARSVARTPQIKVSVVTSTMNFGSCSFEVSGEFLSEYAQALR